MDEQLRRLERLKNANGSWSDVLAWRRALKQSGGGAGLDLGLPHSWDIVGSLNTTTFGQALAALRGLCADDGGLHPFAGGIARPLTFKETVQARVDQFEHEGLRGLWTNWLDTCSAIVYQRRTTKFRIISMSDELLNRVPESFTDVFLVKNYADFASFEELDVQDDVYNQPLTQDQVLEHKGWHAVVEGDKKLLKRYSEIVFSGVGDDLDVAMSFDVRHQRQNNRWFCPQRNEMQPIGAGISGRFNCIATRTFNNTSAFFALVVPPYERF